MNYIYTKIIMPHYRDCQNVSTVNDDWGYYNQWRHFPDSNVGRLNVGPTLGRQFRRWANVYCCLSLVVQTDKWTNPRQQCRLAQRWLNVGTVVPTLGQRWFNFHCCLGWDLLLLTYLHFGLQLVVKHPRFMITKQCFYPHKLDLDSFYNADIALQNIAINATINRSLNWPNGLHNTSQ